jgi:hypothetical protein
MNGLFNNIDERSYFLVLDDRMINEEWNGSDLEVIVA